MGVRERVGLKFKDEIEFLKGWRRDRTAVGAITPTSVATARKMASVINSSPDLPVLELGPGTGVITKEILARGVRPKELLSVEYSPEFCRHLRQEFPEVDIRCGDAFALDLVLGAERNAKFDCVISAVPLLHLPPPKRLSLILDLLERVPKGLPAGYEVRHLAFMMRNIPPAQLWTYRKTR
ncbi:MULTISPECIES: methyltransferase domain-containing protein [unclassified Rhizobium]|uniref:class I SAM-dependent methyltransferase n=1 Tax=unclassified Rhizobium TaxID=2613769 RepID=UPI000EA94F43|nr:MULTISPECIES: methyltransferase domain-containing protein [unclassified Rhizobium]AYG70900.1 methyltransferase domain-containing protein [Rhizobium sp. CCGE531]AYG77219.1 methyltransferase domain-containing protein [Rhizobium sp. CCGE532]